MDAIILKKPPAAETASPATDPNGTVVDLARMLCDAVIGVALSISYPPAGGGLIERRPSKFERGDALAVSRFRKFITVTPL